MSPEGIAVIVPTRNNADCIEAHVNAIRPLLNDIDQLILVDSHSNDGTWEILQASLKHPSRVDLRTPPGLYSSWNTAIEHTEMKWVTFATVGDTITQEGLAHLIEVAKKLSPDVLISPPKMKHANGEPSSARWPIHAFAERCISSPRILTPLEAFLGCCGLGFESILGSSASNLYATQFLKLHPFPEDYGHLGDTGWAAQNCLTARIAVTPRSCSEFVSIDHRQMDFDESTYAIFLSKLAEDSQKAAEAFRTQDPDLSNLFQLGTARQGRFSSWVRDKLMTLASVLSEAEELRGFVERLEIDRQMKLELNERLAQDLESLSEENARLHRELGQTRSELERLSSFANLAREKLRRLLSR